MQNYKSIFTVQTLNRTAILVAMSAVLKTFLSLESLEFRLTFYGIPLIILGIMMGPVIGIIGGFVVDWIYVIISPFAFTFNLFTLSAISWALIPALLLYRRKDLSWKSIAVVVVITSLTAFTFNSLGLYIFYQEGMYAMLPLRFVTLLLKLPIQIAVINILYQRVIIHDLVLLKQR